MSGRKRIQLKLTAGKALPQSLLTYPFTDSKHRDRGLAAVAVL